MLFASAEHFFQHYFRFLTGNDPYPWQRSLFNELIGGKRDLSLGIPTGTGKTSVMQIWLIALGWSKSLPRRLVWVVNNRIVVDQGTSEAGDISDELNQLPASDPLRTALESLSAFRNLLRVSTLRGHRADNREWSNDPSCPAIVVGTVDMIGSRLLFRGYGDSRYWRPKHAGLLAVDSLIVLDEAHLTPAFEELLETLRILRPASALAGKSFHVIRLSATPRPAETEHVFAHSLSVDEQESPRFHSIYNAEKRLHLLEAADNRTAEALMLELGSKDPTPRTIVFIEKPEDARRFAEKLRSAVGSDRVLLVTGTMRGKERDDLVETPVFQAFTKKDLPEAPVWIIGTSALEVGANISAERLITTLTTADHLIQRFGRLNRFGDPGAETHIVGQAFVIAIPARKKDEHLEATLVYLRSLPPSPEGTFDISCRSMYENVAPPESKPAPPAIAPLEQWHIDLWSQTTAPSRNIPPVEPWLHGSDHDIPETEVAWRAEVSLLTDLNREDVSRYLRKHRVRPHERLREPSSRVAEKLGEIAADDPNVRALVVRSDGL